MSKAVVKIENEGKDQVMTVICEYSREFTVYLQKNIHKNVKSYDGNGTWIFTGGSFINSMILEKVSSIFGIEEEVKEEISTKEISPAPAPTSSSSTVSKKEIVAIVEEKKEVAKKIATEKEVKKMNKRQDRIANTKAAKSGVEIRVDLRNCKSVSAVKKAFKEVFYGIKTDFLNVLTYFELDVLRFQGEEISIDNIGGCEGLRYNLSFGKQY